MSDESGVSLQGQKLSWEDAHHWLGALSDYAGEWAGIPMPVSGETLVVHPKYPFANALEKEEPPADYRVVNMWTTRDGSQVVIMREADGRLTHCTLPSQALMSIIRTVAPVPAWKLDAEMQALNKLCSLVTKHAYYCYAFTGTFLETSKRSGVTYLFRRLRPTVALRQQPSLTEPVRFLAGLCLHPIGYYADSYAGAMVPTDDVIAHLLLMRADEKLFWRWSNQHGRGTCPL